MPDWLTASIAPLDQTVLAQAIEKQQQLTKPQGALGVLETIATTISALQGSTEPRVEQAQIVIFAADHGIAQENVSAFPQAVTAEMVKNFSAGGAAISVLAKQFDLPLQVINLGLVTELPSLPLVQSKVIAKGTQNFLSQAAMTEGQLLQAFEIAKNCVDEIKKNNKQLFIAGEMGIANTSSATALVCALENIKVKELAGYGTGLDSVGLEHKIDIIEQSIHKHQPEMNSALNILQILGGFEIAALTASYIRCAQQGIIALVDGFICSVAALFAIRLNPQCRPWLIFSHQSAEQGHKKVLALIDAKPLLKFDLRLGEGSGAALAYPLIRSACLLQNEMASFASASVSEKSSA
ncbi:nicotinate-nucleotide--dimethylbenzimidazole phosphoribosyltransferase [sulfur-oxidizing endosymbiont of Gigantopelta aegis]|uniref:nicotinate-nucleotide--dimethylbenzimidazole phosphoribosyltransferase n=1 Tax=sulfur-oxidizing endosymbiont of Gigantopelta aegis TaxID=2794934 RepID=UPI0018DCFE5B|nr:nicotinate-nucleotide--dimethylbenzimidazole phosphoribosyltransferase [sulfur-oxidizing endosymbiont of Gigantopelta aegis]